MDNLLTEVTHHFGNDRRVITAFPRRIQAIAFEESNPDAVLALMERYAPGMDYADACAVLLSKTHKGSVVVTTDHHDFATYKVPLISPKGAFHGWESTNSGPTPLVHAFVATTGVGQARRRRR